MADIRVKRGTRAQLDAAATAGELVVGEPYLITDENRFAVGISTTSYEAMAKESEAGGASKQLVTFFGGIAAMGVGETLGFGSGETNVSERGFVFAYSGSVIALGLSAFNVAAGPFEMEVIKNGVDTGATISLSSSVKRTHVVLGTPISVSAGDVINGIVNATGGYNKMTMTFFAELD